MKRAQQAIGKLFFCLRIASGWNSLFRLVLNTKRFSRYYQSKERSVGVQHKKQQILHADSPGSIIGKTGEYRKEYSGSTAIQINNEQPTLYHLSLRDKENEDATRRSREVYLRTYAGDIQMFYDLMLERSYEVPELNHSKNLVIVDAGANIGMAALYFFHQYHVSKIFCIEPDAKNIEVLKLNLRPEIKDGKVVVSANALSSYSGTIAWNNSGWAYNARLDNIHSAGTDEGNQTQNQNKSEVNGKSIEKDRNQKPGLAGPGNYSFVNTITIEEFLRAHEISHIDLLKIDVEGSEEDIFRGELSWLDKVQRLIIEIHTEPATELIKNKLTQAGFNFRSCSNSPHSDIYLAVKKTA